MKLTHVEDHSGFPHDTAEMQLDILCPGSIEISGHGPWATACADGAWPVGVPLYVVGRIQGQGQGTSVTVHLTLADARAGTNVIAWYTGPAISDATVPQDLLLDRVGAADPNLQNFHVDALPNLGTISNPLWSIYSTPSLTSAQPELSACDAAVAALEAHTAEGYPLAGVASITCGPDAPAEEGNEVIHLQVADAPAREDLAPGIKGAVAMFEAIIEVRRKPTPDQAWRRMTELMRHVVSILTDSGASVIPAHQIRAVGHDSGHLGAGELGARARIRFRVDLLDQ